MKQIELEDIKGSDLLYPYEKFLLSIKDLEDFASIYDISLDVPSYETDKDRMPHLVAKLEEIKEQFLEFFNENMQYSNSIQYCSTINDAFELFSNCIDEIKMRSTIFDQGSKSLLRLSIRFLPILRGFFEDYYFLD